VTVGKPSLEDVAQRGAVCTATGSLVLPGAPSSCGSPLIVRRGSPSHRASTSEQPSEVGLAQHPRRPKSAIPWQSREHVKVIPNRPGTGDRP
jgi:hypothetical protein